MLKKALMIAAALAISSGCSDQKSSTPDMTYDPPLSGISTSSASNIQEEQIADGAATADEYRSAFQRYQECLRAEGYVMHDMDTQLDVFQYSVPNQAVASGADEKCYVREFKFVDILWQDAVSQRGNSEEDELVRNCLLSHGIEPADDYSERALQLRESGIDIQSCLEP